MIYVKRQSTHSTYTDYRMGFNTFGCKQFADAYEIDEAVLLAKQLTTADYTATAVFADGTPVTAADVRSLYTGMGSVDTLIDTLAR
jgi:hypothetical protein